MGLFITVSFKSLSVLFFSCDCFIVSAMEFGVFRDYWAIHILMVVFNWKRIVESHFSWWFIRANKQTDKGSFFLPLKSHKNKSLFHLPHTTEPCQHEARPCLFYCGITLTEIDLKQWIKVELAHLIMIILLIPKLKNLQGLEAYASMHRWKTGHTQLLHPHLGFRMCVLSRSELQVV